MAELPQREVVYIIILGTLGMLTLIGGLAVFITVYQRRMLQEQEKRRIMDVEHHRKMIQAQIDSQEVERKRIAADLHDSIGSLLWAAKLNIAFLGRSINLDGELKTSYYETMTILDQSIDSIKRISWELTPKAFYHTGLSASVRELCMRLDGKGQTVIFEESRNTAFWRDDRALMTFRIIQELVSNAIKHSHATTIKVELSWDPHELLIVVSDNGVGFKLNPSVRNGVGWWNIEQRSDKIGARVIQRDMKNGTTMEIKVSLLDE
jgi:signal transduction histidine kinase